MTKQIVYFDLVGTLISVYGNQAVVINFDYLQVLGRLKNVQLSFVIDTLQGLPDSSVFSPGILEELLDDLDSLGLSVNFTSSVNMLRRFRYQTNDSDLSLALACNPQRVMLFSGMGLRSFELTALKKPSIHEVKTELNGLWKQHQLNQAVK